MQQMTNHRPLAELDLLDDFLFNALLDYPEYGRKFCRKFRKRLNLGHLYCPGFLARMCHK